MSSSKSSTKAEAINTMTPPKNLSRETLIIWEGWRSMGLRQVIRESAAKGSHIELAYLFLHQRKPEDSLENVKTWFRNEVLEWVMELLENKQIFRASHLLKNLKLDPFTEIANIMRNATDSETINFLASHLEKNEQLDEHIKLHLRLFNILLKDTDALNMFRKECNIIANSSLQMLLDCDTEWKSMMAAKLFLKYHDFTLSPLLSPMHLWLNALESNDRSFLKNWLELQYTTEESALEHNEEDQLTVLLSEFYVTEAMVDEMNARTDILDETKEFVYDLLSQYGIFNNEELNDIQKIIARTTKNSLNEVLEEVLSQPTANLNYEKFKLQLKEFCIKRKMYIELDACLHDEDFFIENNGNDDQAMNLLVSCKQVANNLTNRYMLTVNLQQVNAFLQQNNKSTTDDQFQALFEMILKRLQGEDLQNYLINNTFILNTLPTLNIILNKMLSNPQPSEITRYELLKRHLFMEVDDLFAFRYNSASERPNFKSTQLVEQHGLHKTLDYALYLLHCRPGKALSLLNKPNLNLIENEVRTLAIENFKQDDITATCIYFLDSLKLKTEILKIELSAANMLHQNLSEIEVKQLFITGKTYQILNLYEAMLFPTDNTNFIENYTQFEFVIKLSMNYGCQLPELYLKQLAIESKWLEFIFIIHKFDYPQEQVNKLITNFTNPVLYDHLSHALAHDLVYEPKNILMRDRDARKFFLARIGLLKHMETDLMSSVTSQSSWGSNTSSSGLSDYITEIECSTEQRTDLLQVLIRCHNSNDPPKALLYACQHYKYPLFAVLATTYEPDSVVTCWLTWLSISCNVEVENCERLATVGNNVTAFLKTILEKQFYKTLHQSLCIFLLDNPLKIFMDFLVQCQNFNFNQQQEQHLQNFKKMLKMKRSNSYVSEMDHEMLYLNNKLWIEATAITLLASILNNLKDKTYSRVLMLKSLMDLDLQQFFFTRLPDLNNLYYLFNYFHEEQITTDFDFHKLFDANQYKNEIKMCIQNMLAESRYEVALKVAQVENTLIDKVLSLKWASHEEKETETFWTRCDAEFRKYSIHPINAVIFYENAGIADDLLQYKILILAYSWCRQYKLDKQQEIELKMWLVYLKLDHSNAAITIDNDMHKSYMEMKADLEQIVLIHDAELTESEQDKLTGVIDKLLNAGSIYQALRVQKLFANYKNVNLDIFRLCYSLAEGLTLPIQLTAQERLLIRKVKNNRTYSHRRKPLFSFRLSTSNSRSPASSFGTLMEIEPNIQDTLSLLENLIDGLTSGTEIGERIVMTYRISMNTGISYNKILAVKEPTTLLLNAMNTNCPNKIEVVHDFFCIYNWNKQQIADLLCEQLINSVNSCTKTKLDTYILWDVNLDQDIHLILQLLPDSCSILGTKLYSYSSTLHKAITITNDIPNLIELTVVIELLILSHDCYTYDCNMEGISIILKKCQTLINLLLAIKNWSLIVRLLTGVGRYNELNYVFHILRENDQFENLLRKGSAKDNGLRVALLDYLKKFCPENRSLYEMVALYFSLYSEVAQIWEAESQQSIKNLIAISKLEMINRKVNPDECIFVEFSNTEGTKICLSKAMENYSHAAEYHLQGEKLAKAMAAACQAELIALQISLIKTLPVNATTNCILNLTTLQISALILTLTFQQALIVTEAYNYQTDWALTLFEHFIIKNDGKYFDNYLMTFNITDNLAHNLSRHYMSRNITSEHGIRNMKIVLQLLPSIHTKYRIASELGFSDLIEELLNSDKLNYLKDTVWKRGYRD